MVGDKDNGSSRPQNGGEFDPVVSNAAERAARRHGEWALELVRWYEADWQLAFETGRPPAGDRVLEVIEPSRRTIVRELFDSIDSQFGSRAASEQSGSETPTVDLPSESAPAEEPAPADEPEEQAMEATIAIDQDSTHRSANEEVAAPLVSSETMDFSHGGSSAGSSSVRVGGKSAKRRKALPDIPGYALRRVLGRGGMGVVYLAEQAGIERLVALKMVLAGGHASERMLARFDAEARAVGQLEHENIVRIYDSGVHEEMPYFALEFVDGPALSDLISDHPMESLEAAKLLQHLARALDYAHGKGIIHRDLKPANILLTQDGVPKVSDFGLAKQLEDDNEFSRTGDVLGTPSYMSPEQASGDRDISASTDIYSLGALLYSMLTGRPPFNASKPTETIVQVIRDEPIVPTKLQPGLDPDLETICLKCLQKSPAERYGSAGELADDLQRYAAGEPILARPISQAARAWRWSKRNPKLAFTGATAGALALVLAVGGPLAAAVINEEKNAAEDAKALAQQNQQLAEKNEKLADANAERAEAAKLVAQENEELAEKHAEAAAIQERNAIDTLKELVFRVQRLMKGQPAIQPLRLELLDVARDGLAKMEASGVDENAQNIIAAGVFKRLGDVNVELGTVLTAQTNYEDCLRALEALDKNGDLKSARHNFSTVYDRLGLAASRSGDLVKAREYVERCLEVRRQWAKEDPGNAHIPQNVAATLGQLGNVAVAQGDLRRARKVFEESKQLREQFVESEPNNEHAKLQLIGANRSMALLEFQEGDSDAAETDLREIVSETESLAEKSQQPFAIQHNAALFRSNLGDVQLYSGNEVEAAKTYQVVIDECKKLAETDPNDLRIQSTLASAEYRLGVAQSLLGDEERASEAFKRCVDIRRQLYDGEPDNLRLRIDLLLAMARQGDLAGADKLLKAAETSIKSEPGMLYQLACCYGLLGSAIEGGAEAPNDDWSRQEMQNHAIAAIEKSFGLGFRRISDLRLDPDLEPVRDLPRFAAILEQVQQGDAPTNPGNKAAEG